MASLHERFTASFGALAGIGHSEDGGWTRLAWTSSDSQAREWFRGEADRLGLEVETDRNGNLWAWWGDDRREVVATGSHLDTVIDGGAFDGALGVVSGLLAIEQLQAAGRRPDRAIAVAAFVEEEGARFGIPTLGSRLMLAQLDPVSAGDLTDGAGVRFSRAMGEFGLDAGRLGPDRERLARLSCFVELHIEQGRGLVHEGAPVGVISEVWPHGRWRVEMAGVPDHAGAALLDDRRDPMLVLATAIREARAQAKSFGARATVGRVAVAPNTTNTVPGTVRAWLDARAPTEAVLDGLVGGWIEGVEKEASSGINLTIERESFTPPCLFDRGLSDTLGGALERIGIRPTELPTAAGHDAAVLARAVPTAMLHVRNPTGASHTPAEHASVEDCVRGVEALAAVLEDLAFA